MKNALELVVKNFKILFRNKSSTLIFILGPLAVVLMLGFAFNSSDISGLKLGVYSYQESTLTLSLLEKLSGQFSITQTETTVQCVDGVKLNDWHVCLVFPEDFSITGNNTIEFYVNPTKINLVDLINNMISAKVAEEKGEISTVLVDAILRRMTTIQQEIEKAGPLINQIESLNAEIKEKGSKIQNDFTSLNLDIDTDSFKVGEMTAAFENISEQTKAINKAKDNITDAATRAQITAAYEIIAGNLTALEGSLGNMSVAANETKEKLEKAKEVQSSADAELSSTQLKLIAQIDMIHELEKSVGVMRSQSTLSVTASQIVSPINTNIRPVTQEKRHINFIFPVLIVLLLMFGGIFLGSSLIISEKNSRAYFRNLVVPVRRITFIAAAYITTMLILLIECTIVFGVLYALAKIPLTYDVAIAVFLIASFFVFLGLFIGYFSKTPETAMLFSIALVALLLFFSNLILPIETISYLRQFAEYNPFTIASSMVKENILLSIGFENQTRYIVLLFLYLAIAFAATLIAQHISKRRTG